MRSQSGDVLDLFGSYERGFVYSLKLRVSVLIGAGGLYYVGGFGSGVYDRGLAVRRFSSKYYVITSDFFYGILTSRFGVLVRKRLRARSVGGFLVSVFGYYGLLYRVFAILDDYVTTVRRVYCLYVD